MIAGDDGGAARGASFVCEARGIVKTFPGVRALDGVDLAVRAGEVHALVGENGAGKSTLMHVLAGIHRPDSGTIRIGGKPVVFRTPHEAIAHGIGVVFQELSLVPKLSVAENLFANRQPVNALGLIRRRALLRAARDLVAWFGLDLDPACPAGRLSMAQQQVVEVLKACSRSPRLLILDEPTSSLTAYETRLLFDAIGRMKAEGASFVYISHHLPEIFDIADRVSVLRDGRCVATQAIADVTEETLVRNMVGREISDLYGSRTTAVGDTYFRVLNASRPPHFTDVSFSLRRGEILGLGGLVGAGRTELGRAIFGLDRFGSGEIRLEGALLSRGSPQTAIARGIAYLTEDRKSSGIFTRMSVRDNCLAPTLGRFSGRTGLLSDREMSSVAEELRARFDIATPDIRRRVGNLSGGNQQKVLLAMWVNTRPKILVADEPTRGVDVGARSEIYGRLRELTGQGVGILLISSDLPELLGLSDRILVMRHGRLAGEFSREEATEEKIIACAAGVGLR